MTASSTTTTTRLHITPFTPDLLPSVLPAPLQSTATDVSFHNLPTFPENNYGYVTLPALEAEKMKKKLNGSILKGKKFKVETARPEKKKRELEQNETEDVTESPPKKKSSKKRKAAEDNAVLDGYELPSDRKVKRGWTESTDAKEQRRKDEKKKRKEEKRAAKSQAKSKYTEKEECLFRTQVPPNKPSAKDEKQDKKLKKKNKSAKESVVHEFANTVTHPSFLRSGTEDTAPTSAFEQEKGWVDDSGNVKEPTSSRVRKLDYRPGKVAGAKEKRKPKSKEPKPAEESEDWTSSSGSSGDSDSDSDDSASTSDEDSNDGQTKAEKQQSPSNTTTTTPNIDAAADQDENESSTTKGDGQQQQQQQQQQPLNEAHPLEAIFKRSAPSENKPAEEVNPHFSFFGNNDDIESDEEEPSGLVEPQTPFTRQDIQARGLRSAAPTPDTGLVGRTVKWSDSEDDSMIDGDDDNDEGSVYTPVPKKAGVDQEETEFAKWFWENRGDNNRAWKRRRREVAKEERQRENRRKGMKGKS